MAHSDLSHSSETLEVRISRELIEALIGDKLADAERYAAAEDELEYSAAYVAGYIRGPLELALEQLLKKKGPRR
jgi:hypothetical protein